jgi:hypothetical protein
MANRNQVQVLELGTPDQILVHGELFPDGAMIERLRDARLLLWIEGRQEVGRSVNHCGRIYAPAHLDRTVEQLLRLPAEPNDYGSSEDLINELRKDAVAYAGVDDEAGLLMAVSVLATWVGEFLPGGLVINVHGAHHGAVLDFMVSVCRRAVRVLDPSLDALVKLPQGLAPTLVMRQISDRNLRRLVGAGEPNMHIVSRGQFAKFQSPVLVHTPEPIGGIPAVSIRVPLLPNSCGRIFPREAEHLSNKYQSRLLAWRLAQHQNVANSQFDAVGFGADSRVVAQILGATLEGADAVRVAVMMILTAVDMERKSERRQTPAAAVLQTLLTSCHRAMTRISVGEVADGANGLLVGRGEAELTDRGTGQILTELSLARKRSNNGFTVMLDQNTQKNVHSLALEDGLLLHERVANCWHCQHSPNPGDRTNLNENDVHNVHDAHNVN